MSYKKRYDPDRYIDRVFEQELFEELLRREDEARLLAIRDKGGMGKSHLLELFRYRCRTVSRYPVSLVVLDQLDDPSPLGLVQRWAADLSRSQVPLPTYQQWQAWREQQDFAAMPSGHQGQVHAQQATISHNQDTQVAGTIINVAGDLHLSRTPATAEQLAKATTNTVQAFLQDVQSYCTTEPVMLLLDAYEKCDPALQQWLIEELLEPHCYDLPLRPDKLMMVVAGRELPHFLMKSSAAVKSVQRLSRWDKSHLEECLRLYQCPYRPHELETFFMWMQDGLSPSEIIKIIETVLVTKGRAV